MRYVSTDHARRGRWATEIGAAADEPPRLSHPGHHPL